MASMSSAEKAALDLQKQSLSQNNLDLERKDRELAAQIAIANAQQALQDKIFAEYQMGTLNEAKRAALVAEAQQKAELEFQQIMAMRNYGLDVGKLTGNFMGTQTEEGRQFDINTVMNAPRGPADFPAYINRLRGLNQGGMIPGVLDKLFANQPIASISNGGQQTPMPASNTDLALAMTIGNNLQQTATGQTTSTPTTSTGVPFSNLPPTNFLLPMGAAQPNPNYNKPIDGHDLSKGVDLNRYLYQQYMIDPNRPELGYNQPAWAGLPAPYTSPTPGQPGTNPANNVGPPVAPQFGHQGPAPTAPTFGPAPVDQGMQGGTPGTAPWSALPQAGGGSWVSSGYNGPSEYALAHWRPNEQGFSSGYYEPTSEGWEWVPDDRNNGWSNRPPEPGFAPPSWDAQKAAQSGQAATPGTNPYQDQLAAYNAQKDSATAAYQQQLAAWNAQQQSQQAQMAAYQQALAAWNAAHPPAAAPTSGTTSQAMGGVFSSPSYTDPTRSTDTSGHGSAPTTTSGMAAQAQGGVFGGSTFDPHSTANVPQTAETLLSQQHFGGNDRSSLDAVKNMFSGVFGGPMPTIDPMQSSLQNYRKLSPVEQAYSGGLVSELGGMPTEDWLWYMRESSPQFADSPKAYFHGVR